MEIIGFTTRALNVPYSKEDPHNALQIPVYHSVAFEFDSAEQIAAAFRGERLAHVYSRTSNPTVEYFENKLKTLTGSHSVLALSSGMAAIANTIFAIAKTGDNVISGNQLFGHTYDLFTRTLPDLGLEIRFSGLKGKSQVEKLIDGKTRAVYFETVTNPQLEIADIAMLTEITRRYNLLLVADSTMTPPNVFQAGLHGINIEVMSTTKYISGGATSFGGIIADHGNFDWNLNPNLKIYTDKFGENAFIAKLRKNIYRNTGGSMTPQTAYLQIQGLDLLELRVERCYRNCLDLCDFLRSHPKIRQIKYPGLKNSPDFYLADKYFHGIPGTIISFDLESEAECFSFMDRLKIIRRATNLNDNKSLIIHPWSTIYGEFPEKIREAMNIRRTMLRFSAGIENAEDLIADLEQALAV